MGKRKSRAQLESENRILRRSNLAQGVVALMQTTVRMIGLVFIFYLMRAAVGDLAGKQTNSSISFSLTGVNFFADVVEINELISYAVAVISVSYGYFQRRLRKNVIQKMHTRTAELEQRLDPKRSSSHLTKRGDTRPEDL